MSHTPDAALDLLLALRPEDLDADELDELTALAAGANDRAALEADDSRLAELIDAWADEDLFADELFRLEGITGASILARAESEDELDAISDPPPPEGDLPASDVRPVSPGTVERPAFERGGHAGPATGGMLPSWLVPAALAAGLMAALVGFWEIGRGPDPMTDTRTKALVDAEPATRVALQFSVESGDGAIRSGRNGATYGADEALAFRFDVAGTDGWLTLVEVGPDGDWSVLYPMDGGSLPVEAGAHALLGESGAPLVYRPDDAGAGTLQYVAIVQSEPIDPGRVVPGLLAAGLHRADLWPRPVVAVDAVSVNWEDR